MTGLASISLATAASWPMVCFSNNCLGLSLMPWRLARAMICKLRIESPPSSKKLSLLPTRSSLSTSAQIAASFSSTSPTGATKC
ncbi:hypothetical protein D3C81_1985710 [compost metagenome]